MEACCAIADELGLSLPEAAGYVVPVLKTMGAKATRLREMAAGRFISASKPGVFELVEAAKGPQERGPRKVGKLES